MKGSVALTPASTGVSFTTGRTSEAISMTISLALPYANRPASEPRPAIRYLPELYMTMRSIPPSSSHLADRPFPAPPPIIGCPSEIFFRNFSIKRFRTKFSIIRLKLNEILLPPYLKK